MNLKFTSGDLIELKEKLKNLIPDDWKEINPNTFQVKVNGISINFYTTTGTIQFQGNPEKVKNYEDQVGKILNGEKLSISTPLTQTTTKGEEANVKEKKFISQSYDDSEIIIGLVGAIGTQYQAVKDILKNRLINNFKYEVEEIKVSEAIIENLPIYKAPTGQGSHQYERISNLMKIGNQIREDTSNNSVLALGAASIINEKREEKSYRKAYIIDSIKHPDEVKALKEIYGQGFYLIGVYSDINHRTKYLVNELKLTSEEANTLISKDESDDVGHGQHTSDTYHLSDFFVDVNYNSQELKQNLFRFLDIIFGSPHLTPLFEEYAMFMAFTASLRSADLSRQVGAVLTKNEDIIATGANDIPKYGGGLYWPYYDTEKNEFYDFPFGRDYTRSYDSNVIERKKIIDDIIKKSSEKGIPTEELEEILNSSRLKDLIEFGRVVHAEMETLMTCSRNNISSRNSVLFCKTFPCHNCAKHIIAAGVDKVYFIEPYPKSKALEFHSESIKSEIPDPNNVYSQEFTYFIPFIGVGPRKFFDLFSLNSGSGRTIKRKDKDGNIVIWNPETAKPKIQLLPISYLEREKQSCENYKKLINQVSQ
ncbi:cytidine deaminase [Myroides sp. 1354]|uniref:anti-phage dCTP deaminase n=1 Tax=unclassified Myroides TaxID=2642485 RepID=UPI002575CD5D|nr:MULTISPECIES: anti-phage dCTP deaminase [unclassified Myroides]MDM1046605.1 cytidine deaminase [Myroides sp. R163-1]MDM1057552.1 cytidine deaminase [Myroides sp. 1354]MDM1070846.1 cytidine deaminase [Myroides sp. 1372]